eukprot:TRINITY_DN56352_c0_g1_i1.p1 TRINITY_DN56352_c0_g1~~TRINITY_DN56352_c0_g1_i1.p1  ORF type:complete len:154 (+),score=2.02 TRINITY_DN56352_c0_g1_i1:139-600(+)
MEYTRQHKFQDKFQFSKVANFCQSKVACRILLSKLTKSRKFLRFSRLKFQINCNAKPTIIDENGFEINHWTSELAPQKLEDQQSNFPQRKQRQGPKQFARSFTDAKLFKQQRRKIKARESIMTFRWPQNTKWKRCLHGKVVGLCELSSSKPCD